MSRQGLLAPDEESTIASVNVEDDFDDSLIVERYKKPKCTVPYEGIFWAVFLVWAFFCVADRFIGPSHLGSTNGGFLPPPCFPKGCLKFPPLPQDLPFSVRLFDVYQRATGRLFVAVTPFLLMTQSKVTENWFAEHHPRWMYIGDIRATNNRIHYQMALFFLGIPMIIHMWIIFVPILAGVPFHMLAIGEEEPFQSLNPFVAQDGTMFITPADFLRLPLAILTFMILLPLSVANVVRLRAFSLSHWLHIIGAAIYLMDVMRGNHPHAQLWIAPFFIWYFVDRMVSIFHYRAGEATIIHHERLDDNYAVIFLYVPKQKRKRLVGSMYYYSIPAKGSYGDFSHPYTSFQNHSEVPLLASWRERDASHPSHRYQVAQEEDMEAAGERSTLRKALRRQSENASVELSSINEDGSSIVAEENENIVFFRNWNTAFLVQRHTNNRGRYAFTDQLFNKQVGDRIKFWGPYYSEYASLTPLQGLPPLVLLATGAGANYILDFYTWMRARQVSPSRPVQVYYSTNSVALFQFVTDLLCETEIPNFAVSANLTSQSDLELEEELESHQRASQLDVSKRATAHEVKLGRLSLEDCIASAHPDAHVYFCGSPSVQWSVELLAAAHGLVFHPGSRFSPHGSRDIKCVNGTAKCRCTAMPCCLQY